MFVTSPYPNHSLCFFLAKIRVSFNASVPRSDSAYTIDTYFYCFFLHIHQNL